MRSSSPVRDEFIAASLKGRSNQLVGILSLPAVRDEFIAASLKECPDWNPAPVCGAVRDEFRS